MNSITICCYCRKPRDFSLDLHGCPESLEAMKRLGAAVEGIIGIQLDRKPKLITK